MSSHSQHDPSREVVPSDPGSEELRASSLPSNLRPSELTIGQRLEQSTSRIVVALEGLPMLVQFFSPGDGSQLGKRLHGIPAQDLVSQWKGPSDLSSAPERGSQIFDSPQSLRRALHVLASGIESEVDAREQKSKLGGARRMIAAALIGLTREISLASEWGSNQPEPDRQAAFRVYVERSRELHSLIGGGTERLHLERLNSIVTALDGIAGEVTQPEARRAKATIPLVEIAKLPGSLRRAFGELQKAVDRMLSSDTALRKIPQTLREGTLDPHIFGRSMAEALADIGPVTWSNEALVKLSLLPGEDLVRFVRWAKTFWEKGEQLQEHDRSTSRGERLLMRALAKHRPEWMISKDINEAACAAYGKEKYGSPLLRPPPSESKTDWPEPSFGKRAIDRAYRHLRRDVAQAPGNDRKRDKLLRALEAHLQAPDNIPSRIWTRAAISHLMFGSESARRPCNDGFFQDVSKLLVHGDSDVQSATRELFKSGEILTLMNISRSAKAGLVEDLIVRNVTLARQGNVGENSQSFRIGLFLRFFVGQLGRRVGGIGNEVLNEELLRVETQCLRLAEVSARSLIKSDSEKDVISRMKQDGILDQAGLFGTRDPIESLSNGLELLSRAGISVDISDNYQLHLARLVQALPLNLRSESVAGEISRWVLELGLDGVTCKATPASLVNSGIVETLGKVGLVTNVTELREAFEAITKIISSLQNNAGKRSPEAMLRDIAFLIATGERDWSVLSSLGLELPSDRGAADSITQEFLRPISPETEEILDTFFEALEQFLVDEGTSASLMSFIAGRYPNGVPSKAGGIDGPAIFESRESLEAFLCAEAVKIMSAPPEKRRDLAAAAEEKCERAYARYDEYRESKLISSPVRSAFEAVEGFFKFMEDVVPARDLFSQYLKSTRSLQIDTVLGPSFVRAVTSLGPTSAHSNGGTSERDLKKLWVERVSAFMKNDGSFTPRDFIDYELMCFACRLYKTGELDGEQALEELYSAASDREDPDDIIRRLAGSEGEDLGVAGVAENNDSDVLDRVERLGGVGAAEHQSSIIGQDAESEFSKLLGRKPVIFQMGKVTNAGGRVDVNMPLFEGAKETVAQRHAIELRHLNTVMEYGPLNSLQRVCNDLGIPPPQGSQDSSVEKPASLNDTHKVVHARLMNVAAQLGGIQAEIVSDDVLRTLFFAHVLSDRTMLGSADYMNVSDDPVMRLSSFVELITSGRTRASWQEVLSHCSSELRSRWEIIPDVEPLNRPLLARIKLKATSGEKIPVTFQLHSHLGIPSQFIGFISDSCVRVPLHEYPNIAFVTFSEEPQGKLPSYSGGFMLIETLTSGGDKALVIRGYNPTQTLLAKLEIEQLFENVVTYTEEIAKELGCKMILAPCDAIPGLAFSNRPFAHLAFGLNYGDCPPVSIPKGGTTFNKLLIHNKCRVIRVLRGDS